MYGLWLTLTANFHQFHASIISYIVRVELLHHQHFIDATLELREKSNNNQINKYEFLIEPNRCFVDRVHTAHNEQSMKSHSKINLYASNVSSDNMLSCIEYYFEPDKFSDHKTDRQSDRVYPYATIRRSSLSSSKYGLKSMVASNMFTLHLFLYFVLSLSHTNSCQSIIRT